LYNRHTSAAKDYQQLSSQISEDEKLKNMIASLVDYHQKMTANLKQVLNDLPDVPVKPNQDMSKTYTSLREITSTAVETVAKTCQAYEEDVLATYQELLGNGGLPSTISDAIKSNSKRVLEVASKLERIAKAGAIRDMNV
jgi:hypothetical protein